MESHCWAHYTARFHHPSLPHSEVLPVSYTGLSQIYRCPQHTPAMAVAQTVATSTAQLRKMHLREGMGSALHLKRLSGELETLNFQKIFPDFCQPILLSRFTDQRSIIVANTALLHSLRLPFPTHMHAQPFPVCCVEA